ncbi:hypothetical protein FKM82_013093 [Ascaphus truei]
MYPLRLIEQTLLQLCLLQNTRFMACESQLEIEGQYDVTIVKKDSAVMRWLINRQVVAERWQCVCVVLGGQGSNSGKLKTLTQQQKRTAISHTV